MAEPRAGPLGQVRRAAGGGSRRRTTCRSSVDAGDGAELESWSLTCAGKGDRLPSGRRGGLRPPGWAWTTRSRPLPDDVACTEQYGGPQTAHVAGRWGGEPVDIELSRVDGCRISQWDALVPVVPRRGVIS